MMLDRDALRERVQAVLADVAPGATVVGVSRAPGGYLVMIRSQESLSKRCFLPFAVVDRGEAGRDLIRDSLVESLTDGTPTSQR